MARIAAMGPDLVLVQRNVSRLAQERLLQLGISLVLNVKPRVLERVARMTGAVIVHSIDAQVGRPQLGSCSHFCVKTFTSESGKRTFTKTVTVYFTKIAKYLVSNLCVNLYYIILASRLKFVKLINNHHISIKIIYNNFYVCEWKAVCTEKKS